MNLTEKFQQFHEENPHVYRTLVYLARQWVNAGHTRLGIATLFERARWEFAMSTTDPDYKINNNYKPYYARLIMSQEPDLDGLFELRRAAADLAGVA